MMTVRSTEGIPEGERLDYWRHSVLYRMEPIAEEGGKPFAGRLVYIAGENCAFVHNVSEAIHTRRDRARLRRDDCDEILVGLVERGAPSRLSHEGSQTLRQDDLCIADFSRPIEYMQARNREITLMFRRSSLTDALKGDVSTLAGRLLPRGGISAILRSHLRLIAIEAANMSARERAAMIAAASEMTLLALQREFRTGADEEQFPTGLYAAAMTVIRHYCWNPELNPEIVASRVGCSRATLYRIFAAESESVARVIWNARLDRAHALLMASSESGAFISDIAFRSGFIDMPTFNRMFKRRFDRTPTEARLGTR
ncbi:helix-turn-helix domain-containing protein [Kaistia soli]|nr:helix-turn-helix domain-containing protein [Kaistia soli]